jgi:hypothetical protein
MTEPRPYDPLLFNVRQDVARVDGVMSRVLAEPAVTEEFVRDPSAVMSRFGLHPETSREVHDRVNRIFYAVLTNTELQDLVSEHFANFDARVEDNEPILEAALRRGEIENSVELDMAAVEHILISPEFIRRAFNLTLNDLNGRRLLVGSYTSQEISDYVDRLVQAIVDRRPVEEHPVLEEWDENYGVGRGNGVGFFEVAPPITVVIPVEGFNYLTIYNHTYAYTHHVIDEVARQASRGDPAAVRHLRTTGAMMRLAGEVIMHAYNLDQA